ncbi:MAG TPA: aldo/keto reductase, partial [Enterovirga sp.]
VGASNYSAARLREALEISARTGLPRYESVQPEYNLMERSVYEGELQRACVENEVGVINFFSLASGFLSGKYRSRTDVEGRARGSRVEKYMDERGMRILAALDDAAREHGVKPATIALAWLMTRPGITAPIASATSVEQLQDLVAATRITLSRDATARLDQASA